jgi:hypothetical protein
VEDTDRRPTLHKLYARISARADPAIQPQVVQLLDRVFDWVIERGHGTLAIVVESTDFTVPDGLRDGHWLEEPIDLVARVQTELSIGDRESSVSTRAIIDVVTGI